MPLRSMTETRKPPGLVVYLLKVNSLSSLSTYLRGHTVRAAALRVLWTRSERVCPQQWHVVLVELQRLRGRRGGKEEGI